MTTRNTPGPGFFFPHRAGCSRENDSSVPDETRWNGDDNPNNRFLFRSKLYSAQRIFRNAVRTKEGLTSVLLSVSFSGFNVEMVETENLKILMWDIGGRDKMVSWAACRFDWQEGNTGYLRSFFFFSVEGRGHVQDNDNCRVKAALLSAATPEKQATTWNCSSLRHKRYFHSLLSRLCSIPQQHRLLNFRDRCIDTTTPTQMRSFSSSIATTRNE